MKSEIRIWLPLSIVYTLVCFMAPSVPAMGVAAAIGAVLLWGANALLLFMPYEDVSSLYQHHRRSPFTREAEFMVWGLQLYALISGGMAMTGWLRLSAIIFGLAYPAVCDYYARRGGEFRGA